MKLHAELVFAARQPKTGEVMANCQDAFASDASARRFAVADGVGSSFFPAEWAALLAERFCKAEDALNNDLFEHGDWRAWLEPIQAQWLAQVRERVAHKHGWQFAHLRNSLALGEPGAAAFVGLELDALADSARWRAMLVGDSCLFHVRGQEVRTWLLADPADFSNVTQFFASLPAHNICEPSFIEGDLAAGDVFLLATDALSKYLLMAFADAQALLQCVTALDAADFCDWLSAAKTAPDVRLQEDDATLVVVRIVDREKDDTCAEAPSPQTDAEQSAASVPSEAHGPCDAPMDEHPPLTDLQIVPDVDQAP